MLDADKISLELDVGEGGDKGCADDVGFEGTVGIGEVGGES